MKPRKAVIGPRFQPFRAALHRAKHSRSCFAIFTKQSKDAYRDLTAPHEDYIATDMFSSVTWIPCLDNNSTYRLTTSRTTSENRSVDRWTDPNSSSTEWCGLSPPPNVTAIASSETIHRFRLS